MSQSGMTEERPFRSGFVCVVGRPNAGKSTLTNALVGQKIAIASDKPQTTRHVVRGIITRPDGQLILIDTPGLHRPRTLLGERLNDVVRDTWTEVDVVAVCLPADQRIGPGDTYLVEQLAKLRNRPELVAVATKTDKVGGERLRQHLLATQGLEEKLGITWSHIFPVCAVTGEQVAELGDVLLGMLPPGPKYYPDDDFTDEPEEQLAAELIREAVLAGVHDELPHSIAVVVEEMSMRADRPADKPLLDIYATMVVERDSQKGIVIGHKGERLRAVGTAARQQISHLLGVPVHLDLRVKVMKDWQRDPKHLNRLGF